MVSTRSQTAAQKVKRIDKSPKASTNLAAVKAYAKKTLSVQRSLQDEFNEASPEFKNEVLALQNHINALESQLAAANNPQELDLNMKSGDEMSADEDEESHVEVKNEEKYDENVSLFVTESIEQTSGPFKSQDQPEDPSDLLSSDDIINPPRLPTTDPEGPEIEYGFLRGPFGRVYQVVGQGPKNAEKLLVLPRIGKAAKYLNETRRAAHLGLENEKGQRIKLIIQGVAWTNPSGHDDPIILMDPRYWISRQQEENERAKQSQNGKARRITFPFTAVKVKWEGKGDATFETRSTVRRFLGQNPTPAAEDYKIGDRVLIEKGTLMPAGDLFIFAAAIVSWRRHAQWKAGLREASRKSPTPEVIAEVPKRGKQR